MRRVLLLIVVGLTLYSLVSSSPTPPKDPTPLPVYPIVPSVPEGDILVGAGAVALEDAVKGSQNAQDALSEVLTKSPHYCVFYFYDVGSEACRASEKAVLGPLVAAGFRVVMVNRERWGELSEFLCCVKVPFYVAVEDGIIGNSVLAPKSMREVSSLFDSQPPTAAPASPFRGKLLMYTAKWCSPCHQMKPLTEQLRSYGIPIEYVDFDAQGEMAAEHGVASLPAFVAVTPEGAKVVGIGKMDLSQLFQLVEHIRVQ